MIYKTDFIYSEQMKGGFMNSTLVKIAIITLAILAAAGAKYILHMPDNNPVEKMAVDVIEKELSDDSFEDVDLSK